MRRILVGVLSAVVLLCQAGCVLAPVMEGVGELGVTPSDRQRLLGDSIKDFVDLMRWGDVTRASLFMTPDLRNPFVRTMSDVGHGSRIVEGRVETVDFDPDSNNADVTLVLRMYREPFFVVQDYREKQKWNFIGNGNWQMTSRVVVR